MNITHVRVVPTSEAKLRAYVTLTLDSAFIVRDIKIIEGNEGLFVAMPSKRRRDGSYRDIAHPLHAEARRQLERVILEAYEQQIQSAPEEAQMEPTGGEAPAPHAPSPLAEGGEPFPER